ncbi:MAG: aminotransferase class III-fold pyridoxal phosphate-dependent enzyme [Hyphomonadaceae bacterium]|nr:aminotransferase class III-fold pyridoxal phosphate-dependent enzyme [Hyphomonadaceae bacterium]
MQHFITPSGSSPFPQIARGEGYYLWDKQGNRYIDGSSGAVASNIGHANSHVTETIKAQADQIAFAYGRVWESEANIRLANRLGAMSDMGYDACFFVSGGSEAMEAAVKFARQHAVATGEDSRWKVISRAPSYHGSTLAMLGVTGDPEFSGPFAPMFKMMPKVRTPLPYRPLSGLTPEEDARKAFEELEVTVHQEGPSSVLAIVIEPVGGTATGGAYAPDFYHTRLRQLCDEHGILLIYDEVMSGAGRTGKFLAAHHWPDCRPDIVALAKGLSGGYAPLGAILVSSEMLQPIRDQGGFAHGHTYAANPQSCAVANAVLEEVERLDLVQNAHVQGERLKQAVKALMQERRSVGDIRGKGLLLGLEIVADQDTKASFPNEVNALAKLKAHCASNGLMMLSRRLSGGVYGEWMMLCPPLIIDENAVGEIVDRLDQSLAAFESQL